MRSRSTLRIFLLPLAMNLHLCQTTFIYSRQAFSQGIRAHHYQKFFIYHQKCSFNYQKYSFKHQRSFIQDLPALIQFSHPTLYIK